MSKKVLSYYFCFLFILNARGQDSLSIKHLNTITHTFTIEQGALAGEGAGFLRTQIANAQYTLLGDYLDSKRIPEFTKALLPLLDQSGYKTMALGIGPVIADILQCKHSKSILPSVKKINNELSFNEEGRKILPIPDLKYEEDAHFIQKAMNFDWRLIGFGYDSWNAFGLLIDEMYHLLPADIKADNESLYKLVKHTISTAYDDRGGNLLQFYNLLKESQDLNRFLKIVERNDEEGRVVASYKRSLEQSFMHAQKMYFEKNRTRVTDEKKLIREGGASLDIDISKEKLFVKWDFNFLSRGFQPYAFYGLGNTLSELAEFNGNTSLNIGVMKRFYKEDTIVKDVLLEDLQVNALYGSLLQMGQRDKWVLIDLRSFVEDFHYWPQKFLANEAVVDLAKRYDLIIIPMVEESPTLNVE